MGVGKTTIGRLLANELKLKFIDSDQLVEDRSGANIPWIFDVEGEMGFRQRESRVLEEIAQDGGNVVSTGGGIVLNENNRELIKKTGLCVYLSANIEQLLARIGKDKKRPLLQNNNPAVVLEKIIKERDQYYRDVANIIVQTNTRPPRQLAKEISRILKPMLEEAANAI